MADYHRDELEGTFYEPELQEVIKTDSDYYRVEIVINHACVINKRSILSSG